jgi:hypothetical protein
LRERVRLPSGKSIAQLGWQSLCEQRLAHDRAVEAAWQRFARVCRDNHRRRNTLPMAKIAKTGDRKKMMDTTKSTDCPKCSKPTRIVKRVKDRERGVPGGVYISCSVCDFYEKL